MDSREGMGWEGAVFHSMIPVSFDVERNKHTMHS